MCAGLPASKAAAAGQFSVAVLLVGPAPAGDPVRRHAAGVPLRTPWGEARPLAWPAPAAAPRRAAAPPAPRARSCPLPPRPTSVPPGRARTRAAHRRGSSAWCSLRNRCVGSPRQHPACMPDKPPDRAPVGQFAEAASVLATGAGRAASAMKAAATAVRSRFGRRDAGASRPRRQSARPAGGGPPGGGRIPTDAPWLPSRARACGIPRGECRCSPVPLPQLPRTVRRYEVLHRCRVNRFTVAVTRAAPPCHGPRRRHDWPWPRRRCARVRWRRGVGTRASTRSAPVPGSSRGTAPASASVIGSPSLRPAAGPRVGLQAGGKVIPDGSGGGAGVRTAAAAVAMACFTKALLCGSATWFTDSC